MTAIGYPSVHEQILVKLGNGRVEVNRPRPLKRNLFALLNVGFIELDRVYGRGIACKVPAEARRRQRS